MLEDEGFETSLGEDDDYEEQIKKEAMSPQEVVDEIARGGEQQTNFRDPPKFDAFLEQTNMMKNRYPNVILYDRSRVKLLGEKEGDDYYHASYVDSYERLDGYILAQAPFTERTEYDFWRMVYQTRIKLIVVLTDTRSPNGVRLIKQFWPLPKKNLRSYANGTAKVECKRSEIFPLCDFYELLVTVTDGRNNGKVKVSLLQYRKWLEDKIVPESLLEFRTQIKKWDVQMKKEGNVGPLCLTCPTGVHRSGTYAVLDIVLDRIDAENKVGLLETASIVRKQRYGCMTYFSHYSHIAEMIVDHALSVGLVTAKRRNQKPGK